MQRDPLALEACSSGGCRRSCERGGYQDGMNLTQYVSGNPMRHRDPTGMSKCPECCPYVGEVCKAEGILTPQECSSFANTCSTECTAQADNPCHVGNIIDPYCWLWGGNDQMGAASGCETPPGGLDGPQLGMNMWLFKFCEMPIWQGMRHCKAGRSCTRNCHAYCVRVNGCNSVLTQGCMNKCDAACAE